MIGIFDSVQDTKGDQVYSISIYSEILISLLPSHLYCIYYLKFSPQAQSLVQQSLSWTVVK